MNPRDILLKHEDLINLVVEHQYIPHTSQANFNEVLGAMREINPNAKYDPGCSGCVADIIKAANFLLQEYKKTKPKFYKFPK